MSITRANGPDAFTQMINLTPQPDRLHAGGVVRLTADMPPTEGTFTVGWTVTGPVRLSEHDTRIALLGTTTVAGNQVTLPLKTGGQLQATLDTRLLTPASWEVGIVLTRVDDGVVDDADGNGDGLRSDRAGDAGGDDDRVHEYRGLSGPIDVLPRPFAAGDDVAVTLKRSEVPPTSDQALWVAIRQSANALGFNNYTRFLDVVMCGEPPGETEGLLVGKDFRHDLRKVKRRTGLPFPNVDRYRLLKAATEVFLMTHCGVDIGDFRHIDLAEESQRLNRSVQPGDLEAQMRSYLEQVPTGTGENLDVLPYLGLIRLKLHDTPIVSGDDDDRAQICYGILAEKLANPCFLELRWS
jgi:hypothetical protein